MLGAQAADLLGCRFAVSPLFELGSAIRTTHRPRRTALAPALAGPGDETSRTRRPDSSTGHATPPGLHAGFPSPTPSGPGTTVHDELDRVAQTPVEQVAHELQRCRADQSDPPAHAALSDLLADPQRARDTITRALLTCWQDLLAPHWPRVQHLLDADADVAHRAQQLTDHGLTHLMQHLHPDVRPGRSDPGQLVTARRPATPRCRRRRPGPHAQRFHLAPAHRRPRPAMAAHHRLPSPRCRRAVAPTGRGPRNGTRCCPRPHPGATPDRPRGTGRHHAPCRALQHGSQQRVPAPAGAARRRVIEWTTPATARAVPANNTRNSPYPGNPTERPSTGPVDDPL